MTHFDDCLEKLRLTLIFVFTSFACRAQSKMIINVFKLLPPAAIYGLNKATKDSMLAGKTYYPPDNDSTAVLAFNYGESRFVKDYMYISASYETSQRASGMVELRSFAMGMRKLIIVSSSGGVEGINYQQQDISAYLYDENKRLSPYKAKVFKDWSVNMFLKPGVPQSVSQVINSNGNLIFNFSYPIVILSITGSFLNNQEYRKWLKGDQLEYRWTGKQFVAGAFSHSN